MTALPTYTSSVNQTYLIESLGGPEHPSSYLDKYPDEVYNTSPDALLYKLIYTLIGPAGVASLKRGYFEARLKFEEMGLQYSELEKFYANPMGFGRIASETYPDDVIGLLNNDLWSKIKSKDQAYRNRVIEFMHAARLGGTPEGMRQAAKSALGQDAEVVEAYHYLFDQNSDIMLDLDPVIPPNYVGTHSTEVFGIKPSPEISQTIVQTITFDPVPNTGSIIIKYENEQTGNIFIESQDTVYTILSAKSDGYTYSYTTLGDHAIAVGSKIVIEGVDVDGYNGEFTILSTTNNQFTVRGEIPYLNSPTVYLGKVTVVLDEGVIENIRTELSKMDQIKNNVKVTGNLTDGIKVQFIGQLANQLDIPVLSVDTGSAKFLTDYNELVYCYATVTTNSGVIPSNEEHSGMAPEIKHTLRTAIDQIKPVATYPVVFEGQSRWNQYRFDVDTNPSQSSSEYSKVVRFVTGNSNVQWPEVNPASKTNSYWIVKNKEVEAPSGGADLKESYQNFHKINSIKSYGPDNNLSQSSSDFEIDFARAFPLLQAYNGRGAVFEAKHAIADHTKPRTGTSIDPKTGETLIDNIYPINYFQLNNVLQKSINDLFWASLPRMGEYEYLEVDLGNLQAINFITFEVLKTPLTISIEYDSLDGETKQWTSVTPETVPYSTDYYAFDSNVVYSAANQSPWQYSTFLFKDAIDQMIYTRYVRIKFTRQSNTAVYPDAFLKKAWPVCVKNLRIGRNV